MQQSRISYAWQQPDAARGYTSGVSLHSHTSMSKETLDFIAQMAADIKILQPLFARQEKRCARYGIKLDYAASYWTPPLTPRLAFDLERSQIEESLQVSALVSITDHDDIQAPLLLRTLPSARHIPVSVEWTAPFADTAFHLGIHNLPSATGASWMKTFAEFTAHPSDVRLTEILAELHALPNVLIVFNHPIWDLYRIGAAQHSVRVEQFLARNGEFIHAFELNALRSWSENRKAIQLANKWNQIVISGGDRHGVEPNANVNLTHAASFSEFVHEVRYQRASHVLFMPQYAEPWKHRIVQSTVDAVRDYPDFPEGSQRWDERAFHPDANGVIRPLSELWPKGRAPHAFYGLIMLVRLLGTHPFSSSLRFAWNDQQEVRLALGGQELA